MKLQSRLHSTFVFTLLIACVIGCKTTSTSSTSTKTDSPKNTNSSTSSTTSNDNSPDKPPEITGKYRVGDVRHCFADISLATDSLGYVPRVDLNDGLSDLADWLEKKKGGSSRVPPRSRLKELIDRHLPGLRGRKDSTTR